MRIQNAADDRMTPLERTVSSDWTPECRMRVVLLLLVVLVVFSVCVERVDRILRRIDRARDSIGFA
jgi:hypothetical protein